LEAVRSLLMGALVFLFLGLWWGWTFYSETFLGFFFLEVLLVGSHLIDCSYTWYLARGFDLFHFSFSYRCFDGVLMLKMRGWSGPHHRHRLRSVPGGWDEFSSTGLLFPVSGWWRALKINHFLGLWVAQERSQLDRWENVIRTTTTSGLSWLPCWECGKPPWKYRAILSGASDGAI